MRIEVPLRFYRRLRSLALRHDRTVSELLQHAVEVQYGDEAVSARLRLVDRLARLEAGLGDAETLQEEIVKESRSVRRSDHRPA